MQSFINHDQFMKLFLSKKCWIPNICNTKLIDFVDLQRPISHVGFFFLNRALHLSIINMKPMETDAIISVAPFRECLDMYNYLKQVNYKTKTTNVWHIFTPVWLHRIVSDLKDER